MTRLLLTFLNLLGWPGIFMAQDLLTDFEAFALPKIEAYAEEYPGVAVSVSYDGKIVWNTTVGYRDLEQQSPVGRNTQFNIYSTSKFITGLAFLRLVKEGKLKNLDQKIRTIDPELPTQYDQITIRHLLTHTSGIRHYKGRKDWITFSDLRCKNPAEAIQHFANDPLEAKPGEKYIYTTFGMVMASHILEKLTGTDYINAINDLVPFSSRITLDEEGAKKATPYIRKGMRFKPIPTLSAECKYGGGGLIASADQLVEAGQIFYDGSIMPLEELKMLLQEDWEDGENNGVSFAIGAGIIEETLGPEPVLFTSIGGASPGGRSYLVVMADLKIAIAITTNCEGEGKKARNLALSLAKKIAGLE